jgi:hypothetical protein
LHLVIPVSLKLLAKFGCDAADVPTADGHLSQICQRISSLIELRLSGARADDPIENRRVIAVRGQSQSWAMREKNRGGKPGSATSGRGTGLRPPRPE